MTDPVISEINFYPLKPNGKGLIGIASCIFDGKLSLNSISVYTTLNGNIRLLFPSKTLPNSKEINVFYPINKETYALIKEAVEMKIKEVSEKADGVYRNEKATT
ncbi:MAG: septation protein SpoVG family protein [bacterium]|nr:septation protein SpoVG family protein [bacterium]